MGYLTPWRDEKLHPEVNRVLEKLDKGDVSPHLKRFLDACGKVNGYTLRVLDGFGEVGGFRDAMSQAEQYAKGRTYPGEIVTYAKPYESFHNWGLAVDIVFRAHYTPVPGTVQSIYAGGVDYKVDFATVEGMEKTGLPQFFRDNGFHWGGTWSNRPAPAADFVDIPHYELRYYVPLETRYSDLLAYGRKPYWWNIPGLPVGPIKPGIEGSRVQDLYENLADGKSEVPEIIEDVKEKGGDMIDRALDFVKMNVWKAAALAALGLLVYRGVKK